MNTKRINNGMRSVLNRVCLAPRCLARWLVVALGVLGMAGVPSSSAQTQHKRLTVHPKSQFWIQGKATTHAFTCQVETVDGRALLPAAGQDSIPKEANDEQTTVEVNVPVRSFDCGNRVMTKDLKETLKMEEHPNIHFELIDARVGAPVDTSEQWRPVEVLGALTVAGKKRVTNLSALGRAIDENRFRIRGCQPLRMTDFNIEPPTKAFGLIKVKDRIEVQFDLLAHTTGPEQTSPFETMTIAEAPACPLVEGQL
jgi:polyisoprenoid-binding protein YceI